MSLNATTLACITNGTLGVNKTGDNTTCNPLQQNTQINAPLMPDGARIFLICLYATIFILGVPGNAIVCWVIGNKKQFSGGDVFMMSLAFADLLASLFVPILNIHDFLSNLRWHLGSAMCRILPSISPISVCASSWSLVLIAADRYRAIVTPMKARLSTAIKLCGIIFTWAIAIGISLPYTLTQRYQLFRGEYFCLEDKTVMTQKQKDIYVISFAYIESLMPISIITVLYGLCIRTLRGSNFCHGNNDTIKRRTLENKKVIRMFILITILFCICTLPYAIFFATINYLLAYKRNDVDHQVIWTLNYSLSALLSINSCMNPFIYARRQAEVKQFVEKAWKMVSCKAVHLRSQNDNTKRYTLPVEIDMKEQISRSRRMPTSNFIITVSFQNNAFDG